MASLERPIEGARNLLFGMLIIVREGESPLKTESHYAVKWWTMRRAGRSNPPTLIETIDLRSRQCRGRLVVISSCIRKQIADLSLSYIARVHQLRTILGGVSVRRLFGVTRFLYSWNPAPPPY